MDIVTNKSGVYAIKNKINGKVYVGSTVDIRHRWYAHRRALKNNKHHSFHLQQAWKKYGEEAFEFQIVEECEAEQLLFREQYWLDFLQSYDAEKGYNICKFAGNTLGFKFSKETKELWSKQRKGRVVSEKTKRLWSNQRAGENNPNYGKSMLLEQKQKISCTRKQNALSAGENNPRAKLSWKQVTEIREKYLTGDYDYKQLAKDYSVKNTMIWYIILYKAWIPDNLQEDALALRKTREEARFFHNELLKQNKLRIKKTKESRKGYATGERNAGAKLTSEQVAEIRTKHSFRKYTCKMLAKEYKVSVSSVQRILSGKSWKILVVDTI